MTAGVAEPPFQGWGTDEAYAEWLRKLPRPTEPQGNLRTPGPQMYPGHYLVEWTCPRPGCRWRRVLWDFVPRLTIEEILQEHLELDLAGPYGTAATAAHSSRARYHVVTPGGGAACGSVAVLAGDPALLRKVKPGRRCQRTGCRGRWPGLSTPDSWCR